MFHLHIQQTPCRFNERRSLTWHSRRVLFWRGPHSLLYILNIHNKSMWSEEPFSDPPFVCQSVNRAVRSGRWRVQNRVGLYHLPLLLQSFGVKWRHFGSMRRCLFCMARSWPSTMSSDSVRMYWPCRRRQGGHVWTSVCHAVFIPAGLSSVSHLVVVDEVEVLQRWNDVFFLHTRDLADLTAG